MVCTTVCELREADQTLVGGVATRFCGEVFDIVLESVVASLQADVESQEKECLCNAFGFVAKLCACGHTVAPEVMPPSNHHVFWDLMGAVDAVGQIVSTILQSVGDKPLSIVMYMVGGCSTALSVVGQVTSGVVNSYADECGARVLRHTR